MTATPVLPELMELFVNNGYGSFSHDAFERACRNNNSKHNMLWYQNRSFIAKSPSENTYTLTPTTISKIVKCIDNVYTNDIHLSDVIITLRVPRTMRDDFGSAATAMGLSKSAYLRFLMVNAIQTHQTRNNK